MKKISKKLVLIIISIVISIAAIITVVTIKLTSPFKPAFYTFTSYMDSKTKQEISKKYHYREYGSTEEFEYAIGNNKAIAGITSDFSIVNLIKEDYLSPISHELSKSLNIPIENIWDFVSKEANEQLNFFDQIILNDQELQTKLDNKYGSIYNKYASNGNYDYKFRDFIVPYFINDRVIAFDTYKILGKTYKPGEEINPLGLNNPDLSLILKTLAKRNNKLKIQWTKNQIENVVYGSSYSKDGEYLNNFSTQITQENYQEWIDNLSQMILKNTSGAISDDLVNIFEPDSDSILNNLINPFSKINAAFLYNGDALDAYYGHDNFMQILDGDRLRILRSQNNVRILDAFVVSSSIDNEERQNIVNYFNKYVFNNMFKTKDELEEINQKLEIQDSNIYEDNGIMRIFDYVNYTPTAKGAYEYIKENYFILDNGSQDQVAIDIFSIGSGPLVKPITPIDKQLLSDITLEFQRKLNGK